jgi:hypothetical protein
MRRKAMNVRRLRRLATIIMRLRHLEQVTTDLIAHGQLRHARHDLEALMAELTPAGKPYGWDHDTRAVDRQGDQAKGVGGGEGDPREPNAAGDRYEYGEP